MVYGNGLRRYLIIFDPHTLVLDRRKAPGGAPSLPLVPARSENFTSSLANTQHAEQSHLFRSARTVSIGSAEQVPGQWIQKHTGLPMSGMKTWQT